jgi:hypothetical protein
MILNKAYYLIGCWVMRAITGYQMIRYGYEQEQELGFGAHDAD